MAVEIYVWLPDTDGNIGHAAMKVDAGIPPGAVYLSRWPSGASGRLKATFQALTTGTTNVDQAYADDVKAEGGAPQKVRLTYLDESAIKKAITENAARNVYQFFADNCAVQVRECMDAGVAGSTAMKLAGFGGLQMTNTPWGLLSYARFLRTLDSLR